MNPFKSTTPPPSPKMAPPNNQTPHPNPNPRNPRQKKMYSNFGRQKTRQQNLMEKYKNQKTKTTTHNYIKLLTMNVNSVHSHGKEVLAQIGINESNSDIVFLTETKLGDYSNTFNVSGYQVATQQNRKQGAGGVMILHKSAIKVHDAESESILEEIQVAKCRYKDLTIIGVYRSPSVLEKDELDVKKTKEQHACIINWLSKQINKLGKSRFVITGDFNLKELAKNNFNPPGLRLADDDDSNLSTDHMWSHFYNKYGLTQHVKDYTHISSTGGPSILDLVFTPPQTEIRTLVVDPERFGAEFDHFAVEFEINLIFKTKDTLSLIRKPNKESWRKIAEDLIGYDLETYAMNAARKRKTLWEMNYAPNPDDDPFNILYLNPEDISPDTERNRKRKLAENNENENNQTKVPFNQRTKFAGIFPEPEFDPYGDAEEDIANYFTEKFRESYLKHTPEIIVKQPPPGGELDYTTKRNIRHSKRLFKTIKWASINGSWSEERLEKAKSKLRLIKKSNKFMIRRDRVANEIRRLEISEKKQRNFFDHMKSFQKTNTTEGPIRNKDGELQTEDEHIANTFNINLGDQLLPGQKPNVDWTTRHPLWNKIRPDIDEEPFHPAFFDPGNTYVPEPEETLSRLYITPQEVAEKIKAANRKAAAGPDELPMEFYAQMKHIISAPLAFLYNLITQTGRVPEAFKTTKVKMLYKKKARDDPQNYRPLSMSNHLGKIWERIMNFHLKTHLEKHGLLSSRQHGFRNGMGTTTNLLQMWEKLIETVEKEGPLCEMWSFDLTKAFDLLDHAKVLELLHSAGISGGFGQSIESWLTNRYQYVEVNGIKSNKTIVGKSCVQGSVFGPTLWLVYIQPLMKRLEKMKVQFYGYADDIAIIKRIRTEQDQREFEVILRTLQEWADEFGMRWSPAKTQRLVFKYQGCRPPHDPREIHFGGVKIVPQKATAESLGLLINSSCVFTAHIKRVRDKIKTMVYQVKRNFANIHPEVQKKIYKIYMQSKIDYGSSIYYPGLEHLIKPINKIVDTFWKLGPTKVPPNDIMSPQLRMIENDLKIVHKMYMGVYPLKYEEIFQSNREYERNFLTRQEKNKDLPIPKWRLAIVKQKFSFRTRFYWNFLPPNIRELKLSLFKPALKKFLIKNKQTFLNFSRNYNIIDSEENNDKDKALGDVGLDNFTGSVTKRLNRSKESNTKTHSASKNPYLKKAGAENKLIKITQPRLLLTGATASVDERETQ